jgi:hypothetical protein
MHITTYLMANCMKDILISSIQDMLACYMINIRPDCTRFQTSYCFVYRLINSTESPVQGRESRAAGTERGAEAEDRRDRSQGQG